MILSEFCLLLIYFKPLDNPKMASLRGNWIHIRLDYLQQWTDESGDRKEYGVATPKPAEVNWRWKVMSCLVVGTWGESSSVTLSSNSFSWDTKRLPCSMCMVLLEPGRAPAQNLGYDLHRGSYMGLQQPPGTWSTLWKWSAVTVLLGDAYRFFGRVISRARLICKSSLKLISMKLHMFCLWHSSCSCVWITNDHPYASS